MTKRGLKYRLKAAMWSFYTDETTDLLRNMTLGDKEYLTTYTEQVDALIDKIPGEYLATFKEILTLKAMYRMRDGSKVLNGTNDKLINNVRQFEDISLKQHIERIERQREQARIKAVAQKKP